MAGALILLALILLAAEAVAKKNKTLEDTSLTDSQVIGWAQVLALIPGASRSGVTITAGLLRGLDRESAARFSFLLSIPAITAAGLYKLVKVSHVTHLGGDMGPYLFSALVAGVFAYVVIRWFLGFMKHHTTGPFIIWRIALGLLLLGLVATNKITNDAPKQSEAPAAGRLAQTAP
jgi:undecaprenyl-diphosphatase